MIFAGKKLENDRTISDYSIKSYSIIHSILKLRGGFLPIQFNSLTSEISGDIDYVEETDENKHELNGYGINFIAICQN